MSPTPLPAFLAPTLHALRLLFPSLSIYHSFCTCITFVCNNQLTCKGRGYVESRAGHAALPPTAAGWAGCTKQAPIPAKGFDHLPRHSEVSQLPAVAFWLRRLWREPAPALSGGARGLCGASSVTARAAGALQPCSSPAVNTKGLADRAPAACSTPAGLETVPIAGP